MKLEFLKDYNDAVGRRYCAGETYEVNHESLVKYLLNERIAKVMSTRLSVADPEGPGNESRGVPPQWTASPPSPFLLISVAPPIRSVLHLSNDVIRIESHRRVPNLWIRFWHRVLLGWRWEAKLP